MLPQSLLEDDVLFSQFKMLAESIINSESIDFNPRMFIPDIESLLKNYHQLSWEVKEEAEKLLSHLIQKFMAEFNRADLITSERIMLALCLIKLINTELSLASDHECFKNNLEGFLQCVFNTNELTAELCDDMLQALKIDANHLPNRLPFHLTAPQENQDPMAFVRLRLLQQLVAKKCGMILKLSNDNFKFEMIPKDMLSFFHNPDKHWLNRFKNINKEYQQLYIKYNEKDFNQHYEDEINQITYLNERERDQYQIFIHQGRFYKTKFSSRSPQAPMKFHPASTEAKYCHHKHSWASFVISRSGKIYMGSHVDGEFHHSAYLSGADVLFAGEIKIDNDGNLRGLTTYSGHYQPSIMALALCVKYFKDCGVNMASDCMFKVLNKENFFLALEQRHQIDEHFQDKLDNDDPSAKKELGDILLQSMDNYTESALQAFAAKKITEYRKMMDLCEEKILKFRLENCNKTLQVN